MVEIGLTDLPKSGGTRGGQGGPGGIIGSDSPDWSNTTSSSKAKFIFFAGLLKSPGVIIRPQCTVGEDFYSM